MLQYHYSFHLGDIMQYSQKLLKFYQIKRTQPFEEFIDSIKNTIILHTPFVLHQRIKAKVDKLNFDLQEVGKCCCFEETTNTIYILPCYIDNANIYLHEMMHAIGTEIHTQDTTIGLANKKEFLIGPYIVSSNLGYGANEGLNQHYTEQFVTDLCPALSASTAYSFCANIMSNLEKLIGADTCKTIHFSGLGVEEFMNVAMKKCFLPNENKILKLLLQLDAYINISKFYHAFGFTYSPDTRVILKDAYQTLLTIALTQAKHIQKEVLFSEIISYDHLKTDNLTYFHDYLEKDLLAYFYQEQYHLKHDTLKSFTGISKEKLDQTLFAVFFDYITHNTIMPEKIDASLKCGEFYNHILLSSMIFNLKKSSQLIYTNDFFGKLTQALFCPSTDLVPEYSNELVQLVTQILASRNVVRTGVEIQNDHIIKACEDISFNLYFMDICPDEYRTLFPYMSNKIKTNPMLVKKMLNQVFKTKSQLYIFKKYMTSIFDSYPKIFQVYQDKMKELESSSPEQER